MEKTNCAAPEFHANENPRIEHSFTLEPEMEDTNDNQVLKNLIEELEIEETLISSFDPLKHNSLSPSTCSHCKLLSKLSNLQSDLLKANQEICATHEILNIKKEQNNDLKGMISRLQSNLTNGREPLLEETSTNCSCSNKCIIY